MAPLNRSVLGIMIFTLITAAQKIKIQLEPSQASASSVWDLYPPRDAADGSSTTFFTTFYASGSKWWRINLGDTCLVSSVKIIRRVGFGYRLKQVSVLTSITNDADPAPDSDQWKLCYYMADPGDTDQERQCTQLTEARYLAVYSDLNDDLNMEEVEVYGYKPSQAGPQNCTVIPVNASCLRVTWSNELAIYQFQYGCTEDQWQTTSDTSAQVCNLRPGERITCRVRVVIPGGFSPETVNSTQMPCTGPSSPDISADIRITDSNREKNISMNVTWSVAEHYCQSLVGVMILVTSGTSQGQELLFTSMAGSAMVDGLEPVTVYTLTVTVTNNWNLSSSTSRAITTPELETTSSSLVQQSNTGIIVGAVIGVVLLAAMATLTVIFLLRWRRKRVVHKTKSNPRAGYQEPSPGSIDSHPYEVVSCPALSTNLLLLEKKEEKHSYMTMNKQSSDVDIKTKTSAIVIQTNVEAKASNGNDSFTRGLPKESDQKNRPQIAEKPRNSAANQSNENGEPNAVATDGEGDCNLDCSDVKILECFLETGQEIMKKQFERLDNLPKGEMNVALLPENKGKSRYKGLYPVDNYRVILDRTSSKGTDYINASHIQGYKREHHFIAAQGPIAETINDFWLMIWQQKVSAVVMVTNLWEDGKKKCEKYWPDQNGSIIQFGELTVKTESEVLWADFVLRTILLTNNKTDSITQDTQSRLIRQFHYLSWPDHGVPYATNPFVMFYEKVSYQIEAIKSPVLVHCSAGVGRTGTFISLDYLLAQARDQGMVNMFECVKRLRERRPSMVQTEEQYIFLHRAVTEALITREFVSSPCDIARRLSALNSKVGRNFIKEEFMHVQRTVNSTPRTFDAGKITRNKERNQCQTVLPNDLYRVYVTGGHQDYINAIMLDGYRAKAQLIATQFPLTNTVNDFWQMVSEQGSRTILQLGKPVTSYFPSRNESAEYAFARIRNLQMESAVGYKATTLQIGNIYNTEQTIKVFEVDWPDNGTLPRAESLLALLLSVEKWQQQSENSKIIITCADGATFCGLVACMFSSLERLKAEQDVDVYNPVLMNRLRRPEFVASLEQYAFIYKILKSYTESFSEYSNFA